MNLSIGVPAWRSLKLAKGMAKKRQILLTGLIYLGFHWKAQNESM